MEIFNVTETFVSINGEGTHAGQLALFIRFAGCNLRCSFCDTAWANQPDIPCTPMNAIQICELADQTGIHNITLTGGEPLLQHGIKELLTLLAQDESRYIEIETNGSVDLTPFTAISPRIAFTMDYKLPGSGMEPYMCTENFFRLAKQDTVKFVAGSHTDLERALQIIQQYNLTKCCHVYLSPVFGKIEPAEIVAFMQQHVLNGVTMQLQMHKIIWDPDQRGV